MYTPSAFAFAVRGNKSWRFGSYATMPSNVLLGTLPPITIGDASQQAFDNGLAVTLNSRLGELSARHPLSVIPMRSTIEKGVTTIDAARQEFGVNLVLLLDVQRSANNVRVNYALVDARSRQQVRSGTITADASDPFTLQDRVFDSVAAALELQLAPTEKRSFTSHGTTEPAAYDYYIRGKGYLQDYVEPEKVESAIMLFGRAVEKDPAYAAAFAGLGEAYFDKYQLTHDKSWSDAAVLNCQKAAELGAYLASAHSCLARVFGARGNYEQAAGQYRRALEIEPGSDYAYGGLATAYEQLGRLEEAEKLYKRAISERPGYWATYNWLFYMTHARYEEAVNMFSQVVLLAPDSFTGYYNLGAVRLSQSKYEEAIPLLERSLSIRPTPDALSNLGTAYFQMRRYEDSAAKYEEAVKLDDKNYILWGNLGDAYYWTPGKRSNAIAAYGRAVALAEEQFRINSHDGQLLGALAEYHAMRGERQIALDYLNRSLKLQPNNPVLLFNAGVVYQQIGESGRALGALERAVSLGIPPQMIRDTPNFEALRKDQRFVLLVNGSQQN
jgi:serine/threonine-protein kinase